MSARFDFREDVRLLAASAAEQQQWLSDNGLSGLPEELALQFDDLSRIPDIVAPEQRADVDAVLAAFDRIQPSDWTQEEFLHSKSWNDVRAAAARLLARIQP